jgi:hypothetical protein
MSFVYPHVSLIALIAAAVVQFALGFIWYSPMTPIGAAWMREMKISGDAKPGAEMLAFPVASIIAAWAVSMVVSWSGASGAYESVLAAWVIALAVGAQILGAAVANSQRSITLLIIHLAYVAVGYALMGVVISLLR